MGITVDIRDRLCAIERLMTYNGAALKASANVPDGLQANQCPIFINFPRQRTSRAQNKATRYETRRWDAKLFVTALGDGLLMVNENMLFDLCDVVSNAFLAVPRLELNQHALDYVVKMEMPGDAGIRAEPFPENSSQSTWFYTITFYLDVDYRIIS
jgi:hypothetical protein